MALCPECNAELGKMDAKCSACGYDFPETSSDVQQTGFAYSALAELSLAIGAFAATLGCIGAIIGGIVSAVNGRFVDAFFVAPISFFLCFAMVVVFIRSMRSDPSS